MSGETASAESAGEEKGGTLTSLSAAILRCCRDTPPRPPRSAAGRRGSRESGGGRYERFLPGAGGRLLTDRPGRSPSQPGCPPRQRSHPVPREPLPSSPPREGTPRRGPPALAAGRSASRARLRRLPLGRLPHGRAKLRRGLLPAALRLRQPERVNEVLYRLGRRAPGYRGVTGVAAWSP